VIIDDLLDLGRLIGQDEDFFTQVDGFLDVMGDEQHGRLGALPELDQLVLEFEAQFDIELAVRLVHQEQFRLCGEGPGNDDTLQHAG